MRRPKLRRLEKSQDKRWEKTKVNQMQEEKRQQKSTRCEKRREEKRREEKRREEKRREEKRRRREGEEKRRGSPLGVSSVSVADVPAVWTVIMPHSIFSLWLTVGLQQQNEPWTEHLCARNTHTHTHTHTHTNTNTHWTSNIRHFSFGFQGTVWHWPIVQWRTAPKQISKHLIQLDLHSMNL